MPRQKSALVGLRIDPAVKEAAQRAAADDSRTLTSLIEKLVIDYCRERGYLPPAEPPLKPRSAEKRAPRGPRKVSEPQS